MSDKSLCLIERICQHRQEVVNRHKGDYPPPDYTFDKAVRDAIVETADAYAAMERMLALCDYSQINFDIAFEISSRMNRMKNIVDWFEQEFPDHVRLVLEEKGRQ